MLHLARGPLSRALEERPSRAALQFPNLVSERLFMMAPDPGPNRMNMKFTNGGRTVVIHLVRGLPPKLSRDKKTITITFAERGAIRSNLHKG
jgi:hypothetical protein